jgi:ABC-type branched-subunit amino acid transport system ATPase component
MISTLELQQFRGLEHVKFENLGRANLIVGGNNAGKTSILEALVMLYGSQGQLQALPTTFRELPQNGQDLGKGFWKLLVRGENISGFKLSGDGSDISGSEDKDSWRFTRSGVAGNKPGIFLKVESNGNVGQYDIKTDLKLAILSTKQSDPATVSDLFNQIAPLNPENESKLEDLLRQSIEPRLRRLRYAKPQGTKTHLVYVDLGEGPMLPFTQLGQAFARTLQVYCEIFAKRPKILLVDEIENGLYYEGLEDYWKGLMAVLEDQDVQLFATTHSRECMEAAHSAAASMKDDPLRFLRLDRRIDDPSKIVATTFGKEEMQTAIEFNREMR